MIKTIVHHEREAPLEVADQKRTASVSTIKLGVDIHSRVYVGVAQYDHAVPKPPQRFEPVAFVPWVERLVQAGHIVNVVYEACGFGFGLHREPETIGARSYVIASRQLDEQR